MKKPIHEKKVYLNVREAIEDIGEIYAGMPAYAYRIKPHDKEIQKKTYTDLRDDVRALAAEFIARGISGKHVALVGKLSYHWVLVYYATLIAGGVLVPLDKEWLEKDLADTGARADISFVFCDGDIIAKGRAISEATGCSDPIALEYGEGTVEELLEAGRVKFEADSSVYYNNPINVDKMSLLVFTSGTTGKGKGAMLSQRNILTDIAAPLQHIDFTFKTVGVLPPHHTFGSTVSRLVYTIKNACTIRTNVLPASGDVEVTALVKGKLTIDVEHTLDSSLCTYDLINAILVVVKFLNREIVDIYRVHTSFFNCCDVNKHIISTFIRSNKTIPFFLVKPFNCSCCHLDISFIKKQVNPRSF